MLDNPACRRSQGQQGYASGTAAELGPSGRSFFPEPSHTKSSTTQRLEETSWVKVTRAIEGLRWLSPCGQLGVTPVSLGSGVQVSGTHSLWVTCPITPSKSPSPGDAHGPGLVSGSCTKQEGGKSQLHPVSPSLLCSFAALQVDVHLFLHPQFPLSLFEDQD